MQQPVLCATFAMDGDVDARAALMRHLDQVWAELAQLVEDAVAGGRPVLRGQVPRPVVATSAVPSAAGGGGLDIRWWQPQPPARDEQWSAYRRLLCRPGAGTADLAAWESGQQHGWDATERAARDALLVTAVAPQAGRRLAEGGRSDDASDMRRRRLHRIERQVDRIHALGGVPHIR